MEVLRLLHQHKLLKVSSWIIHQALVSPDPLVMVVFLFSCTDLREALWDKQCFRDAVSLELVSILEYVHDELKIEIPTDDLGTSLGSEVAW